MSLLSRIFRNYKKNFVNFVRAGGIKLNGAEDVFDAKNIQSFRDSLYLFIGVSMIRETVSSIPLELYRIKNKAGDTEEIMDNPWIDLLSRPNSRQTQKEFMKLSISYYLLAGEAFWYLERDGNGVPTAMANMRPDAVNMILSEATREVVGYEFMQANGQTIRLPLESVAHIKNIDPSNPIRGIGVVRPATVRIVTEMEASKYQGSTFRNQGRLDVAVFVDQDLNDEEAESARKRWEKIYGGDSGARTGFFGQSVKDIKQLSVSPKEMGFIDSMKFLRDDILAALRIPKQMIDTDVNYNNSQVAFAQYVRQACEPVLDAFLDVVNNKLMFDVDPDLFFSYESNVGEDRELKLKEATEGFKSGLLKRDEGRDILGYGSTDGGDEFYDGTQNLLTLAVKRNAIRAKALRFVKTRRNLYRKFVATDAVRNYFKLKMESEHIIKRQQNPVFATNEAREKYVNAYNNNVDRKSAGFRKTVDVYNDGLAKRIIQHFEKVGAVVSDGFLDANNEIREAKNIFTPMMKDLYKRVGDETMDTIANGFKQHAAEAFYTHDQVLRKLEARAEFFSASMLDTDYKELKKVIADGMKDGLGIDEIGRKIRQYFDDMSVHRAKTIARTETGRVVSEATLDAYQQSSVVTGVEWLTAGDDKVRPEHVANGAAGVLPVGAAFPSGEHFPAESTINCRCALSPAV
jgi:HK97 family phage portal protein